MAIATKMKDITAALHRVAQRVSSVSLYLLLSISIFFLTLTAWAITPPQDNKNRPQDVKTEDNKPTPKAQPKSTMDDETIPDSLLHSRWRIQKTAPIEVADLDSFALDLHFPENIL